MYEEGDLADGPNGTLVYRSGQWVPLAQSVRPVTVGTPNPTKQAKDAADLANTRGIMADRDKQRELEYQKYVADLYQKGLRPGPNGTPEPIPGWTPPASIANKPTLTAKERADALQAYKDADAIDRVAASLRGQYFTGPGATAGIYGLGDYLPTAKNKTFDDTGQRARGFVKRALGFTGGEGNTLGESTQLYGPYLPSTSDYDPQILAKIDALVQLGKDARTRSVAILGGIPDANGNVTPVQEDQRTLPGVNGVDRGPGTFNNAHGPVVGTPGSAAPSGSTSRNMPIPPEMQAEFDQYIAGVPRGQMDEAAVSRLLGALNAKYGFGPGAQDIHEWVRAYNEGRGPVSSTIPGPEVPMSAVDQFRNDMVNNPVGAAAANFADMAGMGIPTALAPDKMAALQDAQPISSAAGQIGGALLATKGIGEIGKQTIGRALPGTLGGGTGANFARNLATDMTFGAGYGGVTEGDPLTGSIAAGVGSAAGQGLGGLAGKALGGTGSKAAQFLRDRSIPLTVGQTLGGFPKRLEDMATSIPVVGDMINARRLEGLKSFNEQALGDVTGNQVFSTGPQGIDDLRPQVSGMYDRATAGVTVPVGPQLSSDLSQARTLGASLPPDLADRFSRAMTNRVDPIVDLGQMTGEEFQQIQRALKGYRAETPKAGFEQDYRDSLGMVSNALDANMRAQGGGSVISGLDEANAAYRKLKVAEDAVGRARNGSASGESGIFTPAQLNDASALNSQKFGGSKASMDRPFYELATNGQEVLPSKIPDSGTAGRLATMALPGVLGGAGAGVGAFTGDTQGGLAKGLLAGGLLAAGGTKVGQKALVKALTARPKVLKKAGAALDKNRGLLGSAMAPLLLENFLN